MRDEGFLKRWSRRKLESREGVAPAPEPPPDVPLAGLQAEAGELAPASGHVYEPAREPAEADPADSAEAARLPTMDDVATLTPDSDFSGFVARGVDQAVRRSALKKLFADPHFNAMDGLDIYIDDYNKASPLSDTMLASLRHAARLVERVAGTEADDEAEVEADVDPAPDPRSQQHPPETETR